MKARLAKALAGATVALVLLAPGAQAQNFQFQCPGCTASNPGQRFSDALYDFTVDPSGAYELLTVGTATGVFEVTIYSSFTGTGDDAVGGTEVGSCIFTDPDDNSINPCGGFNLLAGTTYYIGAESTTECTTGQGCNLVVMLREDENGGGGEGTVPEPATMILLGTGMAGVFGAARRRRQQR